VFVSVAQETSWNCVAAFGHDLSAADGEGQCGTGADQERHRAAERRLVAVFAIDLRREHGAVVSAEPRHFDDHLVPQGGAGDVLELRAALVTTRVPATVMVSPGQRPVKSETVPRKTTRSTSVVVIVVSRRCRRCSTLISDAVTIDPLREPFT
jgi:hypothetical protein